MKESITKFDLEAAFKALDEIDIPQNKEGIKANRPALTEIFSNKTKLDTLIEEYYDVSNTEDLNNAKEAREAEVAKAKLARIEKIVDLDAESPEDLLTSYVGKLIMQCPQCMTLFYKNQEDVVEDEADPTTVNVGEACQHCGNETGYTLVGKVGEVTPEEAENYQAEDETEVDVQGTTEDDIDLESSDEDLALDGEELDLEDLELDLNIEDDEIEPEKEESFKANNGQVLAEELTESKENLDDFDKLLGSSEFKKPISDQVVRSMMQELSEGKESFDQFAIDGFNYKILDTFEDEDFTGYTIRYSKNDKDIVDIEFWGQTEPVAVTANLYSPHLMQKVYDNFKAFSNDLSYQSSKCDELQEALTEGVFDKIKDKVGAALKKPLGTVDCADWILENALKDYEKENSDDNLQFNYFLAICFENTYTDGKEITKAPKWDNPKLLPIKNRSKKYSSYKGAEAYGKAESSKADCGAVIIYLANEKHADELAYLSIYFDGDRQKDQDQIDTYYEEVAKAIAASKRYQKQSATASEFEIA